MVSVAVRVAAAVRVHMIATAVNLMVVGVWERLAVVVVVYIKAVVVKMVTLPPLTQVVAVVLLAHLTDRLK